MRTVQDILDSKQKMFNTIAPDTLVIAALNVLNSVDLSYLVVMDGDKYAGLFTERDYTRNVILKGRSSSTTMVKDVMTVDLPMVPLTETVEHCMNMMNSHKTRYLLAFDENRLKGVITIHDILRQVIANKELVFDHSAAQELLDHDEKSSKVF